MVCWLGSCWGVAQSVQLGVSLHACLFAGLGQRVGGGRFHPVRVVCEVWACMGGMVRVLTANGSWCVPAAPVCQCVPVVRVCCANPINIKLFGCAARRPFSHTPWLQFTKLRAPRHGAHHNLANHHPAPIPPCLLPTHQPAATPPPLHSYTLHTNLSKLLSLLHSR